MILVDTSIWIDHFRIANEDLIRLLESDQACTHPFVIAELAAGSLARRDETVAMLKQLHQLSQVDNDELLAFITSNKLWSKGLSVIDLHLLATVQISPGVKIWTHDKRLSSAVAGLSIAHTR